jgi:hypothetical protein
MFRKSPLAPLLVTIVLGIAPSCAFANLPTYGLEGYDYNELILLKVSLAKGQAAAACFFATHNYAAGGKFVWIHPKETIGSRSGKLDKVLTDRVSISQIQSVNGDDWIEINFYWPVAAGERTEKLAAGCGSKPNR